MHDQARWEAKRSVLRADHATQAALAHPHCPSLTQADSPALAAQREHPPRGKAHDRQALALREALHHAPSAVDQALARGDVADEHHLHASIAAA